jgi:hypothetical protein
MVNSFEKLMAQLKQENIPFKPLHIQKILNFYINGTPIAKIEDKSAPTGAAGLIAISAGRFVFDNFTLYETPHAGQDPPPRRAADQSGNH